MPLVSSTLARAGELFAPPPGYAYIDPASEAGQRFDAQRAASRDEVFRSIDHDPGPANLTRVHAFTKAIGATVCAYIVVNGITAESEARLPLGEETAGRYYPNPGVAIVNREGYDALTTERALVHEIAGHSSDFRIDGITPETDEPICVRMGFLTMGPGLQHRGKIWAEGNAEWRAGAYAALTGETLDLEPYQSKLDSEYDGSLPIKYARRSGDSLSIPHTAFCAGIIDLLGLKDPLIFDTLLRTNTDPEALAEFTHRVDAIHRGLFAFLDKIPQERGAMLAMPEIKNALFGLGRPHADILAESTDAFFRDRVGKL